jgi:hypothetical protein
MASFLAVTVPLSDARYAFVNKKLRFKLNRTSHKNMPNIVVSRLPTAMDRCIPSAIKMMGAL